MQDNTQPIAVFDSGVGGLSIYEELKKQLPNENYVYLADQKNAPYGDRSPSEIRKLTLNCLKFLFSPSSHSSTDYKLLTTDFPVPKLIIIACNTSTVSGIDYYRQQLPNIPIIGVVPVVKTASETSKNGRIAILSTVATAKSDYQKNLIEKFCVGYEINPNIPTSDRRDVACNVSTTKNENTVGNEKIVLNIGCPNLVSFIENGITSDEKIEKELVQILKPIVDANCDTLVLGCTHYPFLKKTIKNVWATLAVAQGRAQGAPLQILDSSGAIARQCARVLKNNHLLNPAQNQASINSPGGQARQTKRILEKNNLLNPPLPSSTDYRLLTTDSFLTTGNPTKFQKTIKKLIKLKIQVERISI